MTANGWMWGPAPGKKQNREVETADSILRQNFWTRTVVAGARATTPQPDQHFLDLIGELEIMVLLFLSRTWHCDGDMWRGGSPNLKILGTPS